jgi:hypothetical protein
MLGHAPESLWSAPAERSGDGAFKTGNDEEKLLRVRSKKRCRRFALPPHSKLPADKLEAIGIPIRPSIVTL